MEGREKLVPCVAAGLSESSNQAEARIIVRSVSNSTPTSKLPSMPSACLEASDLLTGQSHVEQPALSKCFLSSICSAHDFYRQSHWSGRGNHYCGRFYTNKSDLKKVHLPEPKISLRSHPGRSHSHPKKSCNNLKLLNIIIIQQHPLATGPRRAAI